MFSSQNNHILHKTNSNVSAMKDKERRRKMNYLDHSGGHLKFKKIASSFHVIQKSWSSFS